MTNLVPNTKKGGPWGGKICEGKGAICHGFPGSENSIFNGPQWRMAKKRLWGEIAMRKKEKDDQITTRGVMGMGP